MKSMLIGLALIATPVMAQERSFDFMGSSPSTIVSEATIGARHCVIAPVGRQECIAKGVVPIGNADALSLSVVWKNGRLMVVNGWGITEQYPKFLEAFTLKYGVPVVSTEKWQNGFGATFDYHVATWHFKEGDLTLKEVGDQRDQASFYFMAPALMPATPKPVVNF